MFTLIVGGAASGKSEYAENLILQERHTSFFYLATMQAFDEECRVRIERHRALRAGKGFETLECPVGLHKIHLPIASAVLLECIGNLVANELYSSTGARHLLLLQTMFTAALLAMKKKRFGTCAYWANSIAL